MTNLQKHEYKNSGIEYIDKKNNNWILKRIKDVAYLYTGNSIPDGEKDYYTEKDNTFPYISTKDIDITNNKIDYNNGLYIKIKDRSFKKTYKNSILLCIEGANAGKKIAITNQTICFVNKLCSLQPNNLIFYKFLYYNCQSQDFEIQFKFKLNGLIGGVSINDLKNIKIYLPSSLLEQEKIANYLDKKCENIDNVIEKAKKQIELLKEYKQSVITETVTKGLDKSVEFKNSGIKWIGKIPKHWKTIAIKRVVRNLICGIAATPDYVSEKEGALFLSAQNIQNGKIDLSTKSYIPVHLHKKLTRKIKPKRGDILQVRVGATIGNVAIVDIEEEFSIYVSLTLIQVNKTILNRYLKYYLSTNSFRRNAELFVDFAGTQGNLNVFDLKNMKIPFPPLSEQKQIAEYLDKKCSQINETIEKKEQLIEKFKEYKKSLIYECVTGKKQIV